MRRPRFYSNSPPMLSKSRSMDAVKLSLVVCLAALHVSAQPHSQTSKKLIEFGWDEPDTAFMREHAAEMEKMPFDGCVFHIDFKDAKGGKGSFTWQSWGDRKFS